MLLETRNIFKKFGSVYALQDVSMNIGRGEVHGLVGENGAGKSTLIKILTGVYTCDSGTVLWDSSEVPIKELSPLKSRELGINVVYQDRNLNPGFNGVENAYLGLPYEKKAGIAVDWAKMRKRVEEVARSLDIELDLSKRASQLSPPERTVLEIIRAMMTDCRLLILDEPTASLTDKESEMLFRVIGQLREKGTSILYVTHRMDEIFRLTQRITIFKNGRMVETVNTADVDKDILISKMTDNWVSEKAKMSKGHGEALLEVEHISSADGTVKDASFKVHRGEILGVFGLGGSGRTEMLECIYGSRPLSSGTVSVEKKQRTVFTPADSIKSGMVLICEDRRGMALVTSLSVRENTVLSTIDGYAGTLGIMDSGREVRDTLEQVRALDIKTSGIDQPVLQLSGGNQQKVVFAKALLSKPKVLLCDEPTQAVDVRTRGEIHKLLRSLADDGSAVVFVSSDLKEVLEVADNILIVSRGATVASLPNENVTAEEVLSYCYAD